MAEKIFTFISKGPKGDPGDPGLVQTIVAGTNISVDSSDPANPIISAADASIANLDDIGDVNAPTPTDGHSLVFDSATQTWISAKRAKSVTSGAGVDVTEVQDGVYSVSVDLTAGTGITLSSGIGNDIVISATGGGGDTLWQENTNDITPTVVKPVRVSALNFNPTGGDVIDHVEGQLQFNTASRTVRMCGANEDTHLDFGREMWIRVKNTTASAITNGSVVVINGGTTGLSDVVGTVVLAKADAKATCHTLGMATMDIPVNGEGEVCIGGFTRGLDLNGYSVGTVLYVSPTTAGGVTTTEPAFPYFSAKIGVVMQSGTTDGVLYIAPDTDPNYQTGTGPGEAQGGETYAIAVANSTVSTTDMNGNGSYMSCIWIPKATINIRGFVVFCTQADRWTAGRMGIYSRGSSDTLLAQTPNRTTNLSVGFNTFTLSTPYTVTANTPYMVAFQFVGVVRLGIVQNIALNPNVPNHFARVDMQNAPSPETTMVTSAGYSTSGNRVWIGIF